MLSRQILYDPLWEQDLAVTNCGLGGAFESYADVVANGLIGGARSKSSWTVGILGPWGCGKSSLLGMVKDRVDKCDSANVHTVLWPAWRYEQDELPLLPLLAAMFEHLIDGKPEDKEICNNIFIVVWSLMAGLKLKSLDFCEYDVGKALDTYERNKKLAKDSAPTKIKNLLEQIQHGYSDFIRALTEYFEKAENRRLVVFIDDLDRCGPKGLSILEAIKTIFCIPGIQFVLALDPSPVGSWLEQRYQNHGRTLAKDYLEKIITIPIQVPKLSDDALKHLRGTLERKLVNSVGGRNLTLPGAQDVSSIRQLKRIYNIAQFFLPLIMEKTAGADANARYQRVLLGLISMRELEPESFTELYAARLPGLIKLAKTKKPSVPVGHSYWDNFDLDQDAESIKAFDNAMEILGILQI